MALWRSSSAYDAFWNASQMREVLRHRHHDSAFLLLLFVQTTESPLPNGSNTEKSRRRRNKTSSNDLSAHNKENDYLELVDYVPRKKNYFLYQEKFFFASSCMESLPFIAGVSAFRRTACPLETSLEKHTLGILRSLRLPAERSRNFTTDRLPSVTVFRKLLAILDERLRLVDLNYRAQLLKLAPAPSSRRRADSWRRGATTLRVPPPLFWAL